MHASSSPRIAIIGLGYVGLPLAVGFARKFDVLGFDLSSDRIARLCGGLDDTREVTEEDLTAASRLRFSDNAEDLAACDTYIVTVPTPIDPYKRPDLSPLLAIFKTGGQAIGRGDLVVFESTVYPGA